MSSGTIRSCPRVRLPNAKVRALGAGDDVVEGRGGDLAEAKAGAEHELHEKAITASPGGGEDALLVGLGVGLGLDGLRLRRRHTSRVSCADAPSLAPAEAKEVPDDPMKGGCGAG